MKILLADSLDPDAVERLRAAGDEVIEAPELTADELPEHIADAEVLVVRSTEVTAETIDRSSRLALVVRAGAGTNNIDTAHAATRGVFVTNVPGRNAIAVAELTMGLLLAVDRHIADATADLRSGSWNKQAYGRANGLFGSTMGIVGLGDIGLATAERALGFGLSVLAEQRPGRSAERERLIDVLGIELVPDRATLLGRSHVVSIHVPACPDTIGMVDAEFLASMRDGAVLINTSRGEIVDAAALIEAMNRRGLRAGLDVFPDEPTESVGEIASALARHPGVVGTHHIGASTDQARRAIAAGTVEVIEAYREGGVRHCVNLEIAPSRSATLRVRHHDRVGVLAAVLAILRGHRLNISNMRNQVFAGSKTAVATIDVSGTLDDQLTDELEAHDDVIGVSVTVA
ncbi:MAG: NAD(P)-dependent oxidoreductase [Acidimicrobiales bacterium]